MRVYIVICLSLSCASTVFGGEQVTFEDLDVDMILQNEDQRKAVVDCLMDRAPCGEYQKLRDTVPVMVETNCANCSPKQKEKFEEVSKKMLEKYPEGFAMITQKYSPKSD